MVQGKATTGRTVLPSSPGERGADKDQGQQEANQPSGKNVTPPCAGVAWSGKIIFNLVDAHLYSPFRRAANVPRDKMSRQWEPPHPE